MIYVTADHSIVQLLLETGKITSGDVKNHPMRAMVTSCVGGKVSANFDVEPKWQFDGMEQPAFREIQPGDTILLSSDGLHGAIVPPHFNRLIQASAGQPQTLVQSAIETALSAGGEDNLTLIAFQCSRCE